MRSLFSSAGFSGNQTKVAGKGASVLYDEYHENVARIEKMSRSYPFLPNFSGAFPIHVYELSRTPTPSEQIVIGYRLVTAADSPRKTKQCVLYAQKLSSRNSA